MSHVTNLILAADEDDPGVGLLNEYLSQYVPESWDRRKHHILRQVDEYAGHNGKVFEAEVWLGCVNGIDSIDELLERFENIAWKWPAQLMVQDQHEVTFTVRTIVPKVWT